jgi:hypothetical protein
MKFLRNCKYVILQRRYEESKLKTHLHFEKKENQLNKFTIENESKREDPISTKNAGNILITTNYTENLNVFLSLFSLLPEISNQQ